MFGRKPLGFWLTVALALVALVGLPAAANALIPATVNVSTPSGTVSFGSIVPISVQVSANDDLGLNSEYWIVVTDPSAKKWYYTGAIWTTTETPFGSGPLAYFSSTFNTNPLNASGTYFIETIIDTVVNGSVDPSTIYDSTTLVVTPQVQTAPPITVTVNGSSNASAIVGDTVAVRLQMDPGTYTGTLAEWWIVLVDPLGIKTFWQGSNPWTADPGVAPYPANSFIPIQAVDTVILSDALGLPGGYTVYFGLDDTNDGNINLQIYGSAQITVAGTQPLVKLNPNTGGVVPNPSAFPGSYNGGPPLIIDLKPKITAGSYGSQLVEVFILRVAPNGTKSFLYEQSPGLLPPADWGWGPVETPFNDDTLSLVDVADFAAVLNGVTTFLSEDMDDFGKWRYYIIVDSNVNNSLDLTNILYDSYIFTVGNDPVVAVVPFMTTWSRGGDPAGALGVDVYVYPGSYGNIIADFWLVAVSPFGTSYSSKLANGWLTGVIDYYTQTDINTLLPLLKPGPPYANYNFVPGGLVFGTDPLSPIQNINGNWTIYFGVDTLNGWVDSNVVYDTAIIKVID